MPPKPQTPNESTLSAYYWVRLGAEVQSRGLPFALRDLSSDTRNQLAGDVHAAVRDRAVLIEFKRDFAGWTSEQTKRQYAPIMARIKEDLVAVSKAAHWFAWGNIGAEPGGEPIKFAPYVTLVDRDQESITRETRSLSAYVQSQCTPLTPEEPVGADLRSYAGYVKRITDAARGSAASESSTVLLWAVWGPDGALDIGSVGTWGDLRPMLSLPGSPVARFLRALRQ